MTTEEEDHGGGGFRHTCMRMVVESDRPESAVYYVKGTWYPFRFSLSITDGRRAWVCNPSEQEVRERADNWDQPVSLYLQTAEQHLAFQQSGSSYAFIDAGDGYKRDEVIRKSHSFERMKTEAERSLSQCEMLSREKEEFENSVYAKFVEVLNSKKAKLRELRDRISRMECKSGQPERKDDSSDKTGTYTGESDVDSRSLKVHAQTVPAGDIA
ncbi:unnamed protein product [Victoria cruziana]